MARLTPVFLAAEPQRNGLALWCTGWLRVIGANAVTLHDAAASVRAGFSGTELSRIWPAEATMSLPWRAVDIVTGLDGSAVHIAKGTAQEVLRAPVVVAAHGSWKPGKLASNLGKINRPQDFLGFKAHFKGAVLPCDLMPMIAFPGGYGGMVWADGNRLSPVILHPARRTCRSARVTPRSRRG